MLCLVFTICSKEYVECASPRRSSEQFYFCLLEKLMGLGANIAHLEVGVRNIGLRTFINIFISTHNHKAKIISDILGKDIGNKKMD